MRTVDDKIGGGMKVVEQKLRRRELKVEDTSVSVWVLTYQASPVYFVHGLYSSERKAIAELKRLAKIPDNKLSIAQKRHNKKNEMAGLAPSWADPMDAYCIKEMTLDTSTDE